MTTRTKFTLDRITTAHTAFETYNELTLACDKGYVPTIRPGHPERVKLVRRLKRDGLQAWNPETGRNW